MVLPDEEVERVAEAEILAIAPEPIRGPIRESGQTLMGRDPPGGRHVYHLYVLPVPDRDAFRARLADGGLQTLIHYPAPSTSTSRTGTRTSSVAVSERLAGSVVILPLYPEFEDDEVGVVADALRAAVR
jgi:dTDP-4-amino-4,6-dideoxygalactose transaminase